DTGQVHRRVKSQRVDKHSDGTDTNDANVALQVQPSPPQCGQRNHSLEYPTDTQCSCANSKWPDIQGEGSSGAGCAPKNSSDQHRGDAPGMIRLHRTSSNCCAMWRA